MFKRWLQGWRRQRIAQLTIVDADGANPRVLHATDDPIEAPHWSPDGRWLVFNCAGRLYRIRADGSAPHQAIDTGAVREISNDHLASPDGGTLYFTSAGAIHAVAFDGGTPRRVSPAHGPESRIPLYLHGITADGLALACVGVLPGVDRGAVQVFELGVADGSLRQVTREDAPVDGPEYSPDGRHLYVNAEWRARRPGDAQLFRLRRDGTQPEQLTFDERVNWFPHVSPDGRQLAYLSYPPGTTGHPANLPVLIRTLPTEGGAPRDIASFTGGQGTLNTNSWSPDGRRLAYVAYPLASELA